MKFVSILVEGQTEETVVKRVLSPHLNKYDVQLTPKIAATRLARGSSPGSKGGIVSYQRVKNDLIRLLRDSNVVMVTTMIDMYGLDGKGFPGYSAGLSSKPIYDQADELETAFKNDVADKRFLPYFAIHEFEAVLFIHPGTIADEIPGLHHSVSGKLQAIKAAFESPEHINHSKPPSKRILELIPRYSKVNHSFIIAQKIGLIAIRAACKHFDEWLTRLESL